MADTPLKIGLTGGIASGKSTVSNLFASLGVPVIDADVIAHQIVMPGQPALQKIIATFGPDFLQPNGTLDRAKLGTEIFNSPIRRKELESILHPRIREMMLEQVAKCNQLYCILAIPLLIESQQLDLVDRVLVVDCSPAWQRQRLKIRNNFSELHINNILTAQATREARLALADDVIDNNSSLGELEQQVICLHYTYMQLAKAH